MKHKLFLILVLGSLFGTQLSFAQTQSGGSATDPAPVTQSGGSATESAFDVRDKCNERKKVVTGSGGDSGKSSAYTLDIKLCNPLGVETVAEAVKKFMAGLIRVAIPFVVVFFIWSGFSFILAQGNPAKIKEAKNRFFNTVIGTLILLGAWTITNAIIGTINSITN